VLSGIPAVNTQPEWEPTESTEKIRPQCYCTPPIPVPQVQEWGRKKESKQERKKEEKTDR